MRARLIQILAAFAFVCATSAMAQISPWPPHDPDDEGSKAEITVGWAAGLRDVTRFDDVQRYIGAQGRIESVSDEDDAPRAVYHWTGPRGRGEVTAFLYRSGDFGLVIAPVDGRQIRMNNFGAFFCPDCVPPVQACGRHPSWVPHWAHWDNFDCPCTVTGPHNEGTCEEH